MSSFKELIERGAVVNQMSVFALDVFAAECRDALTTEPAPVHPLTAKLRVGAEYQWKGRPHFFICDVNEMLPKLGNTHCGRWLFLKPIKVASTTKYPDEFVYASLEALSDYEIEMLLEENNGTEIG